MLSTATEDLQTYCRWRDDSLVQWLSHCLSEAASRTFGQRPCGTGELLVIGRIGVLAGSAFGPPHCEVPRTRLLFDFD
ncbi:hypothetical protein GCM10014715_09800 [Streptomyces spiralis]|uniref:Uncharacterized protein n=1 Tax=Streptomyces spiralis TaxID=66376 RepID=A0A918ZL80_9ACTN|nr:hypothetical protein GCM10014715_09800 [Streptomyces spiralis]